MLTDKVKKKIQATYEEVINEKSIWRKEQDAIRKQEKLDNMIIPAYKFRTSTGQEIVVSCPKRLLSLVMDEGREQYKDNFIYLNN